MHTTDDKYAGLEVSGALVFGYVQACINLRIVAGSKAASLAAGIEMAEWYPFSRLNDLENIVAGTYQNASPILQEAGAYMMSGWYHFGPGKAIIETGAGFLHFQSGSQGYASVVKGPEHIKGGFTLINIDEKLGTALVHSTNPFNRDMQRGIIIGGMTAPGDIDYIDVDNRKNPNYYEIEFH